MPASRRFQIAAVVQLILTLGVILWGAWVRISLSGDGCGDSWPTCDGEIIPLAMDTKKAVEFTHRITSGVVWILSLVLYLWARKSEFRHGLKRAAKYAFILMCTEAFVGAGLVLFKMVAASEEVARGYWTIAHIGNTLLLVGMQAAVIFFAYCKEELPQPRPQKMIASLIALLLLVSATGAIAALGDTLFPVETLQEGIAADFSASAHLFVRLRIYHPLAAIALAAFSLFFAYQHGLSHADSRVRKSGFAVMAITIVQVGAGVMNLVFLAPAWAQLFHLLLADIFVIILTFHILGLGMTTKAKLHT